VVPEIEAVPQVDASVDVVLVVGSQRGQDAQLNATGIAVLRHGANHLDGAPRLLLLVVGLDDLAEGPLAEQLQD
jgi:hypothetical protein